MTASRLDNITSHLALRNGGTSIYDAPVRKARKARPYYLLAVKIDGRWTQEFGDYDKEAVDFERDDYADRGEAKKKDMKVIKCASARQSDCDAAVAKLS